ncbi:V-set and immunoglobulin domain-containing protein 2-like isoform X1 [Hemibagrus wyckioides]|uniref:V-set and immunoglobulin domain-containing protein 2-like isoform X1 n=1 Tax=Hemibagrus wyckioides TaxID=337641 RepID=UPI00266B820E|nr:V-set and immunoglobulin domain-containing protein 2-like isoform X1 [Hemibagrus wyckioides]
MAHAHTLFVCWILIHFFDESRCWHAVVVKSSVFAHAGSSAELSCSYSTQVSQGFTLEWRYAAPGTPAVEAKRILYFNGRLYWVDSWEDRMSLVQNPPVSGVASVTIHSVQPSESGLYICDITNPNDWSGSGQGLINLTVLVAPSVPVCELTGHTYVGDDVTLTCHSSQGVPTPIYSWSREQDTAPLPPHSVVADQRTGSLLLSNLSTVFTGTYTCKASNDLGEAACSIAVKVAHGSSAALVAGVLMGLFLLVLLVAAAAVYFFFCYKKSCTENKLSRKDGNSSRKRQSAGPLLSAHFDGDQPPELRVSHLSPLV